jgi:hypothetical protein
MTKIIIGEDCRNSPKNLFVQKLTIVFAKGDSKYILGNLTDDIRWNIVGDELIQGKENFAKALEQRKAGKAAQLTVQHISTYGKSGAANGTIKFKNGKIRAFCDVYEFKDTKGSSVKGITSHVIEIE